MSMLDISKILMYEFQYGYIKPKYGDRVKLYYVDTDSFIIYTETEDLYKDIANDVETQFNTSNYDENDERPLPIGKNKKVIVIFKDESSGKIIIEFVALRAKAYAYLMEDGSEHKKAKGIKKWLIKHQIIFENYKDSLFNTKIISKSQVLKGDHHNVYTIEINKIVLSSNNDKRLQTFDILLLFHTERMYLKYARVK